MSEGSFWLVKDSDFMNLVKWLGDNRTAELYCLPVVEVLELPWYEIGQKDVRVFDCETGEELVKVQKSGEALNEQQPCYAIEIFDESVKGDDVYVVDEVDDMEADEEEVYTVHGTEHEYTEVDFIGAEVDSHESEVHAAEPEKPHDVEPQLRSEHELHDAEPQQQAQQELHATEQEVQATEHDVEAEVQPAKIDVHASGPKQQAQQELHAAEQEAQAAEHELYDAELEVQAAETDVEFDEGPEMDDEYEEGILGEEFTDSEYEQEENIAVEDNDENTYFRLSEDFDIGASGEQESVRDVQEGEAAAREEFGTEYEDFSELRSLPSDTEAEGSSARRKNVCWFNPATDMEDPQFKLGNVHCSV